MENPEDLKWNRLAARIISLPKGSPGSSDVIKVPGVIALVIPISGMGKLRCREVQ